ncbi:teneurin-3-like [Dipodomys spectabilis]|uniref:teneurin-3-like n=1 Tax=Dipodomys spectabilis TaxID=105255 RepID=UPI001C53DE96|nr:teneurin-3-like [Dipodomys spectabilis]
MDVKERRPYCSLTKSRREKERRYTNSSADNDECRVPTQKSYSSSETLKAFDHDSSRLLYGNRVKDLVHREADEYSRQGQNFTLRQLGVCEPATRRGLAFCAEMGLPHRGYSISAGSDADTENEAVMSPEHAMRLWGRGVKSGRSSCLSSRSNSALTLTDTEHENKSDSDTDRLLGDVQVLDCRWQIFPYDGLSHLLWLECIPCAQEDMDLLNARKLEGNDLVLKSIKALTLHLSYLGKMGFDDSGLSEEAVLYRNIFSGSSAPRYICKFFKHEQVI